MRLVALLSILLAAASGSCAKAVPPETNKPEQFDPFKILDELVIAPCGQLDSGVWVAVQPTIPCPDKSTLEALQVRAATDYKIDPKDPRWASIVVIFLDRKTFHCDDTLVWGCTDISQGLAFVAASDTRWPEIFWHELAHVAIFFGDGTLADHACLDMPEFCDEIRELEEGFEDAEESP